VPAGAQDLGPLRRAVAAAAERFGSTAPADDVRLMVGELLANAVVHAGGFGEVTVSSSPGRVRVTVTDTDERLPRPRRARSIQPGGRGLNIVAALADRWGAETCAGRKAVWFETPAAAHP